MTDKKANTNSEEDSNLHFNLKPFDWNLRVTKDEIPDPQNFHSNEHAKITIPKVGITKLALPINVETRSGDAITVKGNISAYVSLDDVNARGINMSRLARGFYDHLDEAGSVKLLDLLDVVSGYKEKLPAKDGFLKLKFDYPYQQKHWREEHSGWLYYPTVFEIENVNDVVKTFLTIEYTYNSSCPCSFALSEYSRNELDTPSVSHSQRSVATIRVEFDPEDENLLWIEDLVDLCRKIQPSEVLSGIVTRVGEFSMGQMMGSTDAMGFIEDLLRKFWAGLNDEKRILDFTIGLIHYESLNDNYASGFINKSLDYNIGMQ